MTLNHLVWDPLKVPGPLADFVRPDGHLDHVVLAHGAQGLGGRIVCRGAILQEAHRLLPGGQGVHHEAEGGGLALGLLPAPALTLVQGQIPDGVISLAFEVQICQFLKSNAT